MNKNLVITLGLAVALSGATISAIADSTIYTDGIGRMHFLGRDAANNIDNRSNYTNSAEQDLTKKLYERSADGMINDTSYDQHPLKNYENTFPDSRFKTSKYWNTKYNNNVDDATVKTKDTVKGSMTFEKGASDFSSSDPTKITNLEYKNTDTSKTTATKKHWWNKK